MGRSHRSSGGRSFRNAADFKAPERKKIAERGFTVLSVLADKFKRANTYGLFSRHNHRRIVSGVMMPATAAR